MAIAALTHLATSGGGAIIGAVMRFMSDNAKDRRLDKEMTHKFMMSQARFSEKSQVAARKDSMKPISNTRRYAVVLILTAVVTMMFAPGIFDIVVNVPVESEGFSIFGLVFGDGTTYKQLSGFVLIPEVLLWGNAIVSMLFGSNIVKR